MDNEDVITPLPIFVLNETHKILISFNRKISFNHKRTKILSKKHSVKKKLSVYTVHTRFLIQRVKQYVNSISLGYRTFCFAGYTHSLRTLLSPKTNYSLLSRI